MKVEQIFFKNTLRNFSYLISFNDGSIFCIDPFSAAEVQATLLKRKLTAIITTHDHCDHHSGNAGLVSHHNCPVWAHPHAHIPHKSRDLTHHEVIYECQEGENHWKMECVYTPGHTASHIGILLKKNRHAYAFFTGDCFFNAGVGNCRGGDPAIMFHTIENIFTQLPDDTIIYPGHDYLKRNLEFTLSVEKENDRARAFLNHISNLNLDEVFFHNDMQTEREINTFLRLEEKNVVKNLKLSHNDKKSVFLKLRELRDVW